MAQNLDLRCVVAICVGWYGIPAPLLIGYGRPNPNTSRIQILLYTPIAPIVAVASSAATPGRKAFAPLKQLE